MPQSSSEILDHQSIIQKINRIAFQIYEAHYQDKQIIIAGIAENGYLFAEMIAKKIRDISDVEVLLEKLTIDKKNPLEKEISLSISEERLKDQSIIVVDDVLNSGRTLMYGLQRFLATPLKKLSVAVLVNRSHKRYPVQADYVGLSLSTTLQEHVEVDFRDSKNLTAFLR